MNTISTYSKKVKSFIFPIILLIFFPTTQIYASLLNDSNIIFDWAEIEYPNEFQTPNPTTNTQITNDWYYRYYPTSQTYVGVERSTEDVYVLGGLFGNTPLKVGTTQQFIDIICVHTASSFPTPGVTFKYKVQENDQFYDSQIVENTYDFFTNTSSRLQSIITFVVGSHTVKVSSQFDQSHYVDDDNYLYISSIKTQSKSNPIPSDPSSETSLVTANYSPSILSGPVSRYCKYQTWKSSPSTLTTNTTYNNDFSNTETDIDHLPELSGVVLDIETTVSTSIGNYKAVKIHKNTESGHEIIYLSSNSGLLISKSKFDNDGNVISTSEITN